MQIASLCLLSPTVLPSDPLIISMATVAAQQLLIYDEDSANSASNSININQRSRNRSSTYPTIAPQTNYDVGFDSALDLLAAALLVKEQAHLNSKEIFEFNGNLTGYKFPNRFNRSIGIEVSPPSQRIIGHRASNLTFPSLLRDSHSAKSLVWVLQQREMAGIRAPADVAASKSSYGFNGTSATDSNRSITVPSSYGTPNHKGITPSLVLHNDGLTIDTESPPAAYNPLCDKIASSASSGGTYMPSWGLSDDGRGGPSLGSPWVQRIDTVSVGDSPMSANTTMDRSKLSSLKKNKPSTSNLHFSRQSTALDNTEDEYEDDSDWSVSGNTKTLPKTSLGLRSVSKSDDPSAASQENEFTRQKDALTSTDPFFAGPQTPMEVGLYGADGVRKQRLHRASRRRAASGLGLLSNSLRTREKSLDSDSEFEDMSSCSQSLPTTAISTNTINAGKLNDSEAALPDLNALALQESLMASEDEKKSLAIIRLNSRGRFLGKNNSPRRQRSALGSRLDGVGSALHRDNSFHEDYRPPERESLSLSGYGVSASMGNTVEEEDDGADADSEFQDGNEHMISTIAIEAPPNAGRAEGKYEEFSNDSGKKTNVGRSHLIPRRAATKLENRDRVRGRSEDLGRSSDEHETNLQFVAAAKINAVPNSDSLGTSSSIQDSPNASTSIISLASSVDTITYLTSDEIFPSKNPSNELGQTLLGLETHGWPEIFHTLTSVRRIGLHHQNVMTSSGSLHTIVKGVLKHVDNLRSAVAKNALLAIADLFLGMKKDMDSEAGVIVTGLIKVFLVLVSDCCAMFHSFIDVLKL